MNKRYKELLEIVTKFPFLKSTVSSNIKEVYSDAEFLNYKSFIKEYDYTADIFELASKTPKYFRGNYYSYSDENKLPFKNKEDILLYNLIANSDASKIYASNYPVLIEICNVLVDHLRIDETTLSSIHFDAYCSRDGLSEEDKEKRNVLKAIGYLADTFAFGDEFTNYVRSVNNDGKSNFIADILEGGEVSKQLNKLCNILNVRKRNTHLYSEYYIAGKSNITTLLNSAVTKVYDSYSLEDIELFKTKSKEVSNIFEFFKIETIREASLLNNHISDEDRSELTKNFTSADDIAVLTKNVINAFKTESSFDGDKINLIISNVIVGNKKIRDRDFPETKDKVIHEFLRLLFMSSSSSRDFTRDERYKKEINKVINENIEYVLDPYFVTASLLKESVIANHYTDMVKNTRSFIDNVFTTSDRVLRFIDKYLEELQKPVSERKSSVKGVKANIISYGTLYYILSEYGKTTLAFNGVESDGTINPTKLLLLAYGKHHDEIKTHLLEDTGNKESSNYYYSSDNSTNIVKMISYILNPRRGEYAKQLIGSDGVDRNVSVLDQKFHGSFNNIMSYLLDEDDDFDYNTDLSIGVREGSRWNSRRDKVLVPKKYYNYVREAVKLILIQLYNHIVTDYGTNLTAEHLDKLKAFITQKDDTINIVPDTVFAVASQDNKISSLNREYASDVTDYGCLNYIALSTFGIFIISRRDNPSLFKFNINEDLILLPEMDIKYYENRSRGNVSNRAQKILDVFNSLNAEEMLFYKPLLLDNFADEFAFTRTMQVCLFANMLNAHDSASYQYGAYKEYLVDAYALQSDVSNSGASRPIDFIQVFFINVVYPRLLSNNLITSDEIHSVEDSFNKAYTDYDCLLSLR